MELEQSSLLNCLCLMIVKKKVEFEVKVMKSILFIDDEINILNALKRLFRNLEFETYFASNIKEAIEIYIDIDKIDMIITDVKMPNYDGMRVLKIFREASPDSIRIVLSGYASTSSITEAIGKNLAKQYFMKPWENSVLIENIRKMFILEDQLKEIGLFEVIQEFSEIKTSPKMFMKINTMVQNDASIEDICSVVEKDPAITSNVLRIANSAFYSAKTGDIQKAIMFIGLNNLKQLIISHELSAMDENLFAKCEAVWTHATGTNDIYRLIYEFYYSKKIPSILSNAGLIHDIGKIILLQIYKMDYFSKILKNNYNDLDMIINEKLNYQIDHAEIGGYFLNWWTFPTILIEIALYHHSPEKDQIIHKKEVALMTIASALEMGDVNFDETLNVKALEILEISNETVIKWAEEIKRRTAM